MFIRLALLCSTLILAACSGPGGPAQRAGRTVDNAVYDVGSGIESVGQKIERAAQ